MNSEQNFIKLVVKISFIQIALIAYLLVMIWLLFFISIGPDPRNHHYQRKTHLIPFSTTLHFINEAWHSPRPANIQLAIFNIGGNLLLFVPFGMFLVYYLPWLSIWKVAVGTALLVLAIEVVQVTTQVGTFDIDDILFNTLGCMFGFWLLSRIRKVSNS